MMSRATALLLFAAVTGCAHSHLTAFRDPDFPRTRFSRIAVFAQGMTLEAGLEVENQLCHRIAPTRCVAGKSILPPTRIYSPAEVNKYLAGAGVDGVLVIALVADESDTRYFGTITSGSASYTGSTSGRVNFYGNTAYWSETTQGSAQSQVTSTPVYGYSRVAFAQVGLFDRSSGGIAWRGELRVSGSGLLNVSDAAFIRSATSRIAGAMRDGGLIGGNQQP